ADDHAVEVQCRAPLGVAVLDDVHACRLRGQAEAAAAVALGVAAGTAATANRGGGHEKHAVAFDGRADDLLRVHAADRASNDLVERFAPCPAAGRGARLTALALLLLNGCRHRRYLVHCEHRLSVRACREANL